MAEHAEIMEMAKSLGLEGTELRAYVKEIMAERREERALIRAENIRLSELANETKKMEAEAKKMEIEAAERDKKLHMEAEAKKMEIEAAERDKKLHMEAEA